VVIWSGDPLDVLSRVERAFIDGAEVYSYTGGGARSPTTDSRAVIRYEMTLAMTSSA
jgi:hypothetical protein